MAFRARGPSALARAGPRLPPGTPVAASGGDAGGGRVPARDAGALPGVPFFSDTAARPPPRFRRLSASCEEQPNLAQTPADWLEREMRFHQRRPSGLPLCKDEEQPDLNSNSDMRHATLRGLGPGESGTQGRAGVRARGLRGSGCQGAVPGSMRCSPRLHEDRDSRVHTIIISRPPHGQWVRRPRRLGTQSENISRAGGYRRPRNSLPTIPYYTILYHTVSGSVCGPTPPAAQARRRRFKVRKAR